MCPSFPTLINLPEVSIEVEGQFGLLPVKLDSPNSKESLASKNLADSV
jgi:hypothetical protein